MSDHAAQNETRPTGLGAWRSRFAPPPFLALVRFELLRSLRKVRLFLLLALAVAAASTVLLVIFPTGNVSTWELGTRSNIATSVIFGTLLTIALVLLPGYGAASIVVEREQNTFDQLRLTLIKPSGLIAAKITGTLGLFSFFVVALLPVLAVPFFIVGIAPSTVIALLVIVLSWAFTATVIGLFCSVRMTTILEAAVGAYVAVAIISGGVTLAALWVLNYLDWETDILVPEILFEVVFSLSPYSWLIGLANYNLGSISPVLILTALGWQSFWTVLALGLAWRHLTVLREERKRGATLWLFTRLTARHRPKKCAVPRKVRFEPIPDWANPVFWRERRVQGLLGTGAYARVYGACLTAMLVGAATLAYIASTGMYIQEEHLQYLGTWYSVILFMAALVAVSASVGAITRERERETLDTLRMTLQSSRQIVVGKWISAVSNVIPACMVGVMGLLIMTPVVRKVDNAALVVGTDAVSIVITIMLLSSVSILVSAKVRHTTYALLASFFFCFGVPVLALFGGMMLAETGLLSYDLADLCISYIPLVSPFSALEYDAIEVYLSSRWVWASLMHLILTAVLIRIAIAVFARRGPRGA